MKTLPRELLQDNQACKSCPFCHTWALTLWLAYGRYYVICMACEAGTRDGQYSPEEAVALWNTRTSGSEVPLLETGTLWTLLPCPFCGSTHLHLNEPGFGSQTYAVTCYDCPNQGPSSMTMLGAYEAWSTRVDDTA